MALSRESSWQEDEDIVLGDILIYTKVHIDQSCPSAGCPSLGKIHAKEIIYE